MRYTQFGQTDMEVSRICFGTWQFSGEWGSFEEQESKEAMRRALDLGINFFDTAQAYGFGVSERMVGEALEPEIRDGREELYLATKGGLKIENGELLRDSSPQWIRQGVEESLQNLGTDYVDLYQLHWPDPHTPFSETAQTLEELVEEGKIRYVGVSNFDASQMAEFERTRKLDALQPPYHMFRRNIEESEFPYCREHSIGTLVYGPLAHGLLSGKMSPDVEFDEDDWRKNATLFQGANLRRNLEIVEELKRFAENRGHTVPQLAVAWTLANQDVDVSIVGARRPSHIEGTAPGAEFDLSPGDMREIDDILQGAMAVGGPSPEGA